MKNAQPDPLGRNTNGLQQPTARVKGRMPCAGTVLVNDGRLSRRSSAPDDSSSMSDRGPSHSPRLTTQKRYYVNSNRRASPRRA